MKNLIYLLLSLIFITCANNETKEIQQNLSAENIPPSIIEKEPYHKGDIIIKWTAYKHTDKIPVNGKFEKFEVTNFTKSSDLKTAITGVKFNILVSSTNTNDKSRDQKIVNSFFKKMVNTDTISGYINTLESNGSGKIYLSMNGENIEKNYSWVMDEKNREIFIKASINVLDWGAENALNALNEVCLERHTGSDGINKLWPDVDVTVIAKL
jgi:hypothetical protein